MVFRYLFDTVLVIDVCLFDYCVVDSLLAYGCSVCGYYCLLR